jgi:uncharacterized protein YcaQ
MREIEYLQPDPLQVIARSHDITLHSRVLDYKPGMWDDMTYQRRKFFDWGGWLATRPMDKLPHWRVVMHRARDGHPLTVILESAKWGTNMPKQSTRCVCCFVSAAR